MAGGRAETYDQRAEILGSIEVRNRVVAGLRIIVPLIGVLAFLALAAQIYLANLAHQYGVAGIRIDRGILVVETPQYTGISGDGSRFVVKANEARSPLNQSNEITLIDVTLELVDGSGESYFASAEQATLNTATEVVVAPGVVVVSGSEGLEGTLTDVVSDSGDDTIISNGPVDLRLEDGTTIVAGTMFRQGDTMTFTKATVVVPDLPEAEE